MFVFVFVHVCFVFVVVVVSVLLFSLLICVVFMMFAHFLMVLIGGDGQ